VRCVEPSCAGVEGRRHVKLRTLELRTPELRGFGLRGCRLRGVETGRRLVAAHRSAARGRLGERGHFGWRFVERRFVERRCFEPGPAGTPAFLGRWTVPSEPIVGLVRLLRPGGVLPAPPTWLVPVRHVAQGIGR
jgi:hypothetical protein